VWDVIYRYVVDVNSRFVYIDVSKQTPYYRGNVAEIFDEFRYNYKYYMID